MSTVVANSGGPGSSITLDPEIVSMRDRYLKALEGKPFDEMNLLIQKQLEKEGEDIKRLSLLAARVYILRLRTLELRDEPTEHAMPWSKSPEDKNRKNKNTEGAEVKNSENKDNEWRRLRMIEAGEVNGVRFPPGIIIDVNATDGEKLVESKKAEYVDVDKSDENSETEENKADEVTSDTSEEQAPNKNLEKAETEAEEVKAKEDNKQETVEENTGEVASDEEKDEENLADELKELSDTMSSEVDNDKK
jgi:bifunctional autolysin